MSAKELAKMIRRELDRRERYRSEHDRVAVEKVKEVKVAVSALIDGIRADDLLPDVTLEEERVQHRLRYGGQEYAVISYDLAEVTFHERRPTEEGTVDGSNESFMLNLDSSLRWVWSSRESNSAIIDLADFLITLFLQKVAAAHRVAPPSVP